MSRCVRFTENLDRLAHHSVAELCARVQHLLTLSPPRGAPWRRRLYAVTQTFWLFLAQVLAADKSCAAAVQRWLAWLAWRQQRSASPNTGAYCRARQRLPLALLQQAQQQVQARLLDQSRARLFHGRRVKIVDGSSLTMPDTPANQAAYPQPRAQKPGCGFPVLRLVVIFELASAAMVACAKSSLAVSERALFRLLWPTLEPGDLVLGDRGFCSFAELYFLRQQGVEFVVRQHQRRGAGSRRLRRLGRQDWLVGWDKTGTRPGWLTPTAWASLPPTLTLREITYQVRTPGFRTTTVTVVTSLLDPREWRAADCADLYRQRWQAELFLRDLKSTLGMDTLRCQTPPMIEKELQMHLLAYNLLRCLMAEAGQQYGVPPTRLSCKGALAAVRAWGPLVAPRLASQSVLPSCWPLFLLCLARAQLVPRPDRHEPRARKRRPKNYPLLTAPRHSYVEIPHRNRYKKA